MVRSPCCEKMGLKKGPWSAEEDQILISFVQKYGHKNWRALPKQSGLSRCGKSCRLRWINYLRPDIKRGNFTIEEEETIINLHEMLGNRWSAIAARLPGRTDNEIKNVWHTHLKKRLNKNGHVTNKNHKSVTKKDFSVKRHPTCSSSTSSTNATHQLEPTPSLLSPRPSSSDFSSVTETMSFGAEETTNNNNNINNNDIVIIKDEKNEEYKFLGNTNFAEIDESFWSEALSVEISNTTYNPSKFSINSAELVYDNDTSNTIGHDVDFWYDIFIKAGGQSPELPEF